MIVGIDLGTTYSAIAYMDKDNKPTLIPNSEGNRTTPSSVMFEEDGSIIVGEIAKENAIFDDSYVVEFVKNEMGNSNFKYRTNLGSEYTPEEVSAYVLKKLKSDAESFLGQNVSKAVITVPAYFNDAQRKSTQDAGTLAGLEVVQVINEPTAAAIAFGMENKLEDSNILVYDLGGGTFDATIVHYKKDKITVRATDGIRRLGGHFFNQEILEFVVEGFKEKHKVDLYDYKYTDILQELNSKVEDCKIQLNARAKAYIPISCDGIRERIKISRDQYHALIDNQYKRTESIILNILREAELTWNDIDKILLVGGASRTNYIRESLKRLSGKELSSEIHPDEAVAMGAAIQAMLIDNTTSDQDINEGEMKVVDVCSHGIGIITLDALYQNPVNSVIIDRNSQLPAKSSRKFYTSEEDQEIIELEVTEGETDEIEYVNRIGSFEVKIPRGLKRGSEVEIEIAVDESQIVHIYTRIPAVSDFFKEIHINRSSNLTSKEFKKKKDLISKVKINKPTESSPLLPAEIEKEFDGLIGMDSVKNQVLQFINIIKLNEKRGLSSTSDSSEGYHFMLLGNPGTGKTTVARIIAKILHILSIREDETFLEVDKSQLVGQYIGHTEENTAAIVSQAQGGTLFIDEAYTLYDKDNPKDFGRDALNIIMKSMEDHRDSFSIIFAGYEKQMNEMLEANVGLKSRINYIINIPDYSNEELLEIAKVIAEERALILTESANKAIVERINQERIDDKFGNARFIRNLINEAYSNLANRLSNTKHDHDDMFRLEAIDFGVNLESTPEEEIAQAMEELNSLVGLDGVKKEIESIVNTMKVMREMSNRGLDTGSMGLGTLHMAFLGGPGTGKTTVARIIGRIFKALGILKRGHIFIECSRKDLVGEYQGHTGPKTQGKINEAMGGILFVDEAYDLYAGENDSFGKEAITTLIAEMENNRDKLMIILAGYKDDISGLLDANPGFRSRINTEIDFDDFGIEELLDIFKGMVKKEGLILEDGTIHKAEELILSKSSQKDFGNARGVRNILQNIIRNKNNRIAKEMSSGLEPTEEDFLTIKTRDIF